MPTDHNPKLLARNSATKGAVAATDKLKPKNKTVPEPAKLISSLLLKKKFSYKEQREFDGLPSAIQQLESQQKAIVQELFDGSLYATNPKRAAELTARNAKIDDELMAAMMRWETLSS